MHKCTFAAVKEQPLVTSTSADTMHLQAADIVNLVNMCSGPEGCSVAQLLHCIRKGGLQVQITVSGACTIYFPTCQCAHTFQLTQEQTLEYLACGEHTAMLSCHDDRSVQPIRQSTARST